MFYFATKKEEYISSLVQLVVTNATKNKQIGSRTLYYD